MNEITSKQIIINGLLINYYINHVNSPNTVVFVHGWLSNAKVWWHLMHALGKVGFNSIAIDLPGFGDSQVPEYSVDNNFYCEILKDLLTKLKVQKFILVGHSNGGAIAVKYANSYTLDIDKLILIDAAGIRKKTRSKTLKNLLAKTVSPLFKVPFLKPLRAAIYSAMGSEDYINSEYLGSTYRNIINDDISLMYKTIYIPTLIVWGKKDKSTPIEYGEFINSQIKDSKLELIDAGHFPFLEKPNEVINLLIKFIK